MIVDIFTHIFPKAAYEKMIGMSADLGNIGKRLTNVTFLHDLDGRFREMDSYGEYCQIISLPNPPLEDVTTPEQGTELSKVANDSMAELVSQHPDRFPGFVASIAMHDLDRALMEVDRAINELGAKGIQVFSNVAGRPLDDPQYDPLFKKMWEYNLPIWLHPARTSQQSDYASEQISRFELWTIMGWPYATSVAMVRLVVTGLFDRYPGIKIICHHMGGNIPFHEGRVENAFAVMGRRTVDEDYIGMKNKLIRPAIDYFRMFYGDMAMHGAVAPLRCGLEFFTPNNVVFASDAPFANINKCIQAVERLELEKDVKNKVYSGNAGRLMNMSFGQSQL
jgi:predicted TIM-barrel fold metal-dependent hydrolase